MWHRFFSKIVKTLDPKLDRFRESTAPAEPTKSAAPAKTAPASKPSIPKYTPQTLEDFIGVMQRTPRSILSSQDRARIAAIMNFDNRTVKDLMVPRSKMIFVKSKEILGPLVLDKLYKSGFTNFPVIDTKEKVIGVIHTEALNALEIKKTDLAKKYLDPHIFYLHTSDTLEFAVSEIERTNSYYFLVLDDHETTVGFFTIQLLLDYLIGK